MGSDTLSAPTRSAFISTVGPGNCPGFAHAHALRVMDDGLLRGAVFSIAPITPHRAATTLSDEQAAPCTARSTDGSVVRPAAGYCAALTTFHTSARVRPWPSGQFSRYSGIHGRVRSFRPSIRGGQHGQAGLREARASLPGRRIIAAQVRCIALPATVPTHTLDRVLIHTIQSCISLMLRVCQAHP